MKTKWGGWVVAVAGIAFASWANAADSNALEDFMAPPQVHLRKIEKIKLAPQTALDPTNAARIRKLIGQLANVSRPDFGFSPTISGTAFVPIVGTERPGALIFTDHRLQRSDDFTELVRLGPVALPFLLDALTNQTPTKLDIDHSGPIGAMWFADELSGNPANAREREVLGPAKDPLLGSHGGSLAEYRVTVGDLCFVAIGQIVGRNYQALRYQMTSCTVINSPTHDTNIAGKVRQIWTSENPRQHLLDSLLLDFASDWVSNGKLIYGDYFGDVIQCNAAMRLLYYYPKQSTRLVVERLNGLEVSNPGTNSITRTALQAKNGVSASDFIRSVAWSQEPAIQSELRRIFRKTDDPKILTESCAGFGKAEHQMVKERLEKFIDRLIKTEPGPFGEACELLVKLGEQVGQDARPAFERYIQNGSMERRHTMCWILKHTCGEFSVEILSPLLDDRRPAEGWTYGVVPGKNEPRLPIRICDEAADTIAMNFSKLEFKMAGEHKDLDAQIDKMKQAIEHKKY